MRLADGLDRSWQRDTAHFWLVLVDAVLAAGLGLLMSEAGRRRGDARVLLVGLACLASAGFLGLHALATPGVLLDHRSVGFVIATPVGLIIAAGFAAASSIDFDESAGAAVMRHQRALRLGLASLLAAWAAISLIAGSPLAHAIGPERASSELVVIGVAGIALYAVAAVRYARLLRRRPSRVLYAIASAWILLAEALVAVAVAPSWHASWWEWHLLITLAVLVVAWAVNAEYRRPSSPPRRIHEPLPRAHDRPGRCRIRRGARTARGRARVRRARPMRSPTSWADRFGLSGDERLVLQRAAGEIDRVDRLFRPYVPAQLARELAARPHAGPPRRRRA